MMVVVKLEDTCVILYSQIVTTGFPYRAKCRLEGGLPGIAKYMTSDSCKNVFVMVSYYQVPYYL